MEMPRCPYIHDVYLSNLTVAHNLYPVTTLPITLLPSSCSIYVGILPLLSHLQITLASPVFSRGLFSRHYSVANDAVPSLSIHFPAFYMTL